MIYYFYLPDGLIGVTQYYVGIIDEAIRKAGYETVKVAKLKDVPKHANVVTIRDKDTSYVVWFRSPKRVITWFQGICPEEMDVIYDGKWDKLPRRWIHVLFEKVALKKSTLNLFVSEAMLKHYQEKYGYSRENYMIMPCFGNEIDLTCFNDKRYEQPKFLYSGSVAAWQCIDKMLVLFKKIQGRIQSASLSILTPNREEAIELLKKYDVQANVDFVQPDKLQEYIRGFKYGFIVRDDISMNNVATPTKMSNYMGAGIIPVYSDVVHDYRTRITAKNPYVIAFNDDDECIRRIELMEQSAVDVNQVLIEYQKTFNDYWNREKYVEMLVERVKQL